MSRPAALTPVRLRLPVARVERAVLAVGHAALGAALGRWLADGLRHGPFDLPMGLASALPLAEPVLPALATLLGLWLGRRQALALLPSADDGAWLVREPGGSWSLMPAFDGASALGADQPGGEVRTGGSSATRRYASLLPVWDLGWALLLQARDPRRWLWLRRGAAGDAAWHGLRLALHEPAPREDR